MASRTPIPSSAEITEAALREAGLSWPNVTEHFPWGHRTLKVGTKAFVFMGGDVETWSMSVKLPGSGVAALDLPFASPTGYGLGKSGWVTSKFEAGTAPPTDLLLAWLRESYEAVAPRRLWANAAGETTQGRGKAKTAAKVVKKTSPAKAVKAKPAKAKPAKSTGAAPSKVAKATVKAKAKAKPKGKPQATKTAGTKAKAK